MTPTAYTPGKTILTSKKGGMGIFTIAAIFAVQYFGVPPDQSPYVASSLIAFVGTFIAALQGGIDWRLAGQSVGEVLLDSLPAVLSQAFTSTAPMAPYPLPVSGDVSPAPYPLPVPAEVSPVAGVSGSAPVDDTTRVEMVLAPPPPPHV